MKQQITLQNHKFCSVQSTIPPLLYTALFFYLFFNMFWRLRFCHYQHGRSILFKYFKVSSHWTTIQWPYMVWVTGDICFGTTKNASIKRRLCRVEGNAWNINRHFHYESHNLHIVYKHMKNLIIIYVCFVFYVFSVPLQFFHHSLN